MTKLLSSLLVLIVSVCLLLACGDDDGPNGPTKPAEIIAINGLYYKADSLDQRPLEFAVADNKGNFLAHQQIELQILVGDGNLSHRSITTDSGKTATFSYEFTGSLGHAVVRLTVPGIDTLDVYIRRDMLIPGVSGQGQYVLFDDTYADVKNFNGLPASVDKYPNHTIIYVNYEEQLGVVVMLLDLDENKIAYDTSSVWGVIVNGTYGGTTDDSIGIGSSFSSILGAYGPPDVLVYSPDDTAIVADYNGLGLTFYCVDTLVAGDTIVVEMHLVEYVDKTSVKLSGDVVRSGPVGKTRRYPGSP